MRNVGGTGEAAAIDESLLHAEDSGELFPTGNASADLRGVTATWREPISVRAGCRKMAPRDRSGRNWLILPLKRRDSRAGTL